VAKLARDPSEFSSNVIVFLRIRTTTFEKLGKTLEQQTDSDS
jgi:hypothetical protein